MESKQASSSNQLILIGDMKTIRAYIDLTGWSDAESITITFEQNLYSFTKSKESVLEYVEEIKSLSISDDLSAHELMTGRVEVGKNFEIKDPNTSSDKLTIERINLTICSIPYGKESGYIKIVPDLLEPCVNVTYQSSDEEFFLFCVRSSIPVKLRNSRGEYTAMVVMGSEFESLMTLRGFTPNNYDIFANEEFLINLLPENVAAGVRAGFIELPDSISW